MAFKFKVRRRSSDILLPSYGSIISAPPVGDPLTGQVQGQTASAPEERLARALDKARVQYLFRYVVGAPKGMPGWKEVDFIVSASGTLYAIEVDTAFTHRNKAQKDKLHDAIILQDEKLKQMGSLFPTVVHADGDSELATDDGAEQFLKQRIGR